MQENDDLPCLVSSENQTIDCAANYDQDIITGRYGRIPGEHIQVFSFTFYTGALTGGVSMGYILCKYQRMFSDRTDIWIIREEFASDLRMENVSGCRILWRVHHIFHICQRKSRPSA